MTPPKTRTPEADDALTQAHSRIAELESLLGALAACTPVPLFVKDRDLRYRWLNQEAANVLGVPRHEVIGRTDSELIDAERAQKYNATDLRAIDSGERVERTVWFGEGDSEKAFLALKAPFLNAEGEIDGVCGTSVDVTVREQLRRRLAESEERYRLAMGVIVGNLYDVDLKTGYCDRSEGLRNVLGIDPEDADSTAEWWFERIHPEDLAGVLKSHELAMGGIDRWDLRYRVRHGDGHYIRVWDRARIYRDDQGVPVRIVGQSVDITDAYRSEQLAQETKAQLQLALEIGGMGMWSMDDIMSDHLCADDTCRQVLGLAECCNDLGVILERILPDDRGPIMLQIRRIQAVGDEFRHQVRVNVDDSVRWVAVHGRAVPNQLNGIRIVGTARDITSQVEAEAELERRVHEQTAYLREANAEMEGFTYSVSHDLRSPLRAISATARILQNDYGKDLPQEADELLDRQAKSAKHLAQLIDDLLHLSRISREPMRRVKLDLAEIGRGAAARLELGTCRFVADKPLETFGDPQLLFLLLEILIENAVKFSPDGGEICLTQVEREGERFFVLRDNGIGLDMRYSKKIFEPFQRLHRKEDIPGTGIGLANAERIVQRHRGTIFVESTPGEGSAFFFSLPERRGARRD